MFALSISYKRVREDVRGKFAFDGEKARDFLSSLKSGGIGQAVYLSTCGRSEVYGVGDEQKALEIFCRYAEADSRTVKDAVLIYSGKRAVAHLFSVCCGLDSMVIGEDEILGQVKRAYAFSLENGFTDYELNTVFKAAVTDAKIIKTKTLLSKTAVSIATLAANACKRADTGKTVLLIGASGDTGGKVLKNLLSFGGYDIYATVRENACFPNGITPIAYKDRYLYASKADIIISATKSPHFTVTAQRLLPFITENKKRLFIDLAVPCDLDPELASLQGATLLTVDSFEKTAKANTAKKEREIACAREIADEQIEKLMKELAFDKAYPMLKRVFTGEKAMRFAYEYRDSASEEEFYSFLSVVEKMEEKHGADVSFF